MTFPLRRYRIAGTPSSLAAELADQFSITLIGFLRDERLNIYTHPARIDQPERMPSLIVTA